VGKEFFCRKNFLSENTNSEAGNAQFREGKEGEIYGPKWKF